MKNTFRISIDNIKRNFYYFIIRVIRKVQSKFSTEKHHQFLFILSPPYCGSTLLNELICTSKNVSCNNHLGTREGQLLPGVSNIMYQKNRWNQSVKYPWDHIKKTWLKYWNISKPILLDKTITNIMRVSEIKKVFENIKFICIVRNPYAQTEGIIRRNSKSNNMTNSVEKAARFALKCLAYQKKNVENENQLLLISYEELTEQPELTKKKIIRFMPMLYDIDITQRYSAHNFKTKKKMGLTNLNEEKIKKLTQNQVDRITRIFESQKELLKTFNYSMIKG